MRYPTRRKSPCRHTVKAHTRNRKPVRSFVRGEGGRRIPSHVIKRRIVKETLNTPNHEPRLYTILFKYEDKTTEKIKTTARSPKQALRFADIRRKRKDRPVEVVVKNRIGEVIGKIAGYTVKGLKGAVRTYREAQAAYRAVKDFRLNDLIKRAYSVNPADRAKARVQIRKEYPAVYEELQLYVPAVKVAPPAPRVVVEREPPIIRIRIETLAKLQKKMKKKGIKRIPKVKPRRKRETPEQYEQRLFKSIKWAQAAIEKAERERPEIIVETPYEREKRYIREAKKLEKKYGK